MVLTRRLTRRLCTLLLLLVAGFALVTSPVLAHKGEEHGVKAMQSMAKAQQAPAASAAKRMALRRFPKQALPRASRRLAPSPA